MGKSDQEIRQFLVVGGGWSAEDLEQAFKFLEAESKGKTPDIRSFSVRKSSKLASTVMILFLLVGGYFAGAQLQWLPDFEELKRNILKENQVEIPAPEIPTENNNQVQTNPKTFTAIKHGFEFSYPKELFLQKRSSDLVIVSHLPDETTDASIIILTEAIPPNSSVSEYAGNNLQIRPITVGNNITAYEASLEPAGFAIYIPQARSITSLTTFESNRYTLDQILSTFRFTDL